MPEPLTTYVTNWRAVYGYIYSDFYNLHNHLHSAADQAVAHNWEGLAISLDFCADYMFEASRHFKGGIPNLWTTMFFTMDWIDDNWPEIPDIPPEYELTWRKICEALAKDDFEGKYWTIAIIDHMRKLIWDKPFNIVWASKPETE